RIDRASSSTIRKAADRSRRLTVATTLFVKLSAVREVVRREAASASVRKSEVACVRVFQSRV
ncbi:hypothetical protein CSA_007714, partial [Cucumis sativus]